MNTLVVLFKQIVSHKQDKRYIEFIYNYFIHYVYFNYYDNSVTQFKLFSFTKLQKFS